MTTEQVGGGGSFRVLVAEDYEPIRDLIKNALREYDLELQLAEDGGAAFDMLGDAPPGLVLMDLHLPVMGGIELTRRIRDRWPEGGVPKIIAMTGDLSDPLRHAFLEAGGDEVLSKPTPISTLRAAVLGARASWPPA